MGPRLSILGLIAFCFLFMFFLPSNSKSPSKAQTYSLFPSQPVNNYAFSAFLAAPSSAGQSDNDDLYFVGTRMLVYQLLHDPETRTNNSYPFLVLVTEDVCK